MKFKTIVCLAIFLAGLAVLGWRFRPRGYSFSFQDTPVVEALEKVRRKTGEPILFETNLTGKVTAEIRRAPVGYVLDVIGDKARVGWHEVYVIYRAPPVWDEFRKAAVNEAEPKSFKPQDLIALGWRIRGNLDLEQAWQPVRVDFSAQKKSLGGCAKDLGRQSRVRVFVDPSLSDQDVSVNLKQQPPAQVVRALAKAAGAKVGRVLVVRAPWSMVKGGNSPEMAQDESMQGAMRDNLLMEFQGAVAAMPPEERAQVQALMAKYLPVVMSLRALPEEERKAKIAEIANDPEVQKLALKHMQKRIDSSTPEERAKMRQRFAQARHGHGGRPAGGGE